MSESNLEQVKRLAEQLSPEERLQLFDFISDLPDSGIKTGNLAAPETTLDGAQVEEVNPDLPVIVSTETSATIFLRSREIFQVTFRPENFRQSRMEIRSWKDAPPSEKVIEELRAAVRLVAGREVTDEEIIAASKRPTLQLFEAETFRLSNEFAARLKHMVWLLYEAGMKIVELGFHNDFSRRTGQRTKTLDEMVEILEPFWKRIKEHLSLSPGGRRNVKHTWTPTDHLCLDVHYERLKPIWREAKKTARAARNAKEPTRRKRWKEEVSAVYQEENLPADLVERLVPPEDMPPADLALIHAGRLCVPDVTYSLKILKERLRYLKHGFRNSPTASDENEGSSSGGV